MIKHSMGTDSLGESMDTQRKVILEQMRRGRRVSQLSVTNEFGFTRLSSIIFDLKKRLEDEGGEYEIRDETVKGTNRYGNACHFKEYWLERA